MPSAAQKRQLRNAQAAGHKAKQQKISENAEPDNSGMRGPLRSFIRLQSTVDQQKTALVDLTNRFTALNLQKEQLQSDKKNLQRTASYREQCTATTSGSTTQDEKIASLTAQNRYLKHELEKALKKLEEGRNRSRLKSSRLYRLSGVHERKLVSSNAASRTFHIKESGAVPERIRSMIRTLYCLHNVPQRSIWAVVKLVCETADLQLVGSFGRSLVALCVREAGIASHMRFVELCKRTSSISLSTDGTSDRQQHYQSTWCTFKLENGDVERHFLGLRRLADHTSETQLNDLTSVIEWISDYWNRSPLGSMSPISLSDVLRVMRGTNLDHAADMKKLNRLLGELKRRCNRIERGEMAWANLDYITNQARCAQVIDSVVEENGGMTTFYALPDAQQAELLAEGYQCMWHQLGEDEFLKLSPPQQATVDLWFWFGCTMHKELNVIKGGCVGMERVRDDFGLVQPMKWLNKDNEAAAKSGSAELKARAERESRSGGAKLGISVASFLRNKHHEKGVQRGWNDYTIEVIGRSTPCPDAGRVRFHTTTGVCEFIMDNYHHILAFMDLHYYAKKQPGFNNFEQNIYNALHDLPTLTDVAVLAVVHQTMSVPYASATRSESLNAIDLGPLHAEVKALCRRIADDPSLVLLDPTTSHAQCALGSQPYHNPETLATVKRFYDADLLPDFELVLSGFMMDAVTKWDDFTEEFSSSGPLALTSAEDLDLVFFPSTNDRNEGTLGQARCAHRHKPNISDAMLSATLSYKHNDLEASMASLSPANHKFI